MSDLLAIVEDTRGDEALVEEIVKRRPRRVTVLVEDRTTSGDELAHLMHEIESRSKAIVVGMVGDVDQLEGWRFDRVVRSTEPRVVRSTEPDKQPLAA